MPSGPKARAATGRRHAGSVLAALAQNGPSTIADLRVMLPGMTYKTLITVITRLRHKGAIVRSNRLNKTTTRTVWALDDGYATYDDSLALHRLHRPAGRWTLDHPVPRNSVFDTKE